MPLIMLLIMLLLTLLLILRSLPPVAGPCCLHWTPLLHLVIRCCIALLLPSCSCSCSCNCCSNPMLQGLVVAALLLLIPLPLQVLLLLPLLLFLKLLMLLPPLAMLQLLCSSPLPRCKRHHALAQRLQAMAEVFIQTQHSCV